MTTSRKGSGGKRKARQLLLEPPPPTAERALARPGVDIETDCRRNEARLQPPTARRGEHAECCSPTPQNASGNRNSRWSGNEQAYNSSVIHSHPQQANGRQTFKELKQLFQNVKLRSRETDEHVPVATMASAREKRSCPLQPDSKSARRKSELNSFLTILFGSLLAFVLILAGSSLIAAATNRNATQPVPTVFATNDTRPPAMAASSATSDLGSSTPAGATTEAMTALESVSSKEHEAGDDVDLGDEEHDSSEQSNTTRLGNLLTGTASDGADLMIDHLQASPETSEKGEHTELDDSNQLGPEEAGSKANTSSAAFSPLAQSPSVESKPLADGPQPPTVSLKADAAEEATKLALDTYAKWRAASDDIIELFSRKLMPVIIEHGYDVDPTTVGGLLQVFNGIRQLKPWALKLLDASAKIAPGLLVGTQSDFGDFDECLNVRVDDPSGLAAADGEHFPSSQLDPLTGLPSTTLVGRYCLADVEFPKPARRRRLQRKGTGKVSNGSDLSDFESIELRKPLLDFAALPAYKDTIFVETGNFLHMLYVDPIRVGICLTNKIDPENLAQVVNKLLEEFRISIHFRGRCVTKFDKPQWSTYQLVSAYTLTSACLLVLTSTAIDLLSGKLNGERAEWKLAQSARQLTARPTLGFRLLLGVRHHRKWLTSFSLVRNTKRLFKPPVQAQLLRFQAGSEVRAPTADRKSSGASCTSSSATTTSSLAADSSVESTPAIERRSSDCAGPTKNSSIASVTSMNDLIPAAQQRSLPSASKVPARAQQVDLACLHGIRVITMVWMIVNHTYMFGGFFVLWAHRRLIDIAEWPKSLSFQMVLNGWLTVETYFFLSALIIMLNVIPLMRAHKFNYFGYVLHRLLRLLPAYVGLVCLNFLWPLVSSGPVWLVKGRSFVQEPCEQYLWTNFLFINNWIWPEKQCMVHTWFLSADFQLYTLAPIIVYLMSRRPALGLSVNLLVAILASILSGLVIYANELLPTTLINKLEFDSIKQQLSYSYFATYQHVGPYCLGLLTGYLLHKRPHARLPKHLTWLLWLLLPPLSFTTLLLTYLWNGAYSDASLLNPSPLVSALYVAIHRIIWSSLVAWLVFATASGRAKLLASFLSHPVFLPVSRLSYSIYLVHLPVIMFRALNLRHTLEWTDQNILWEACGNFVASMLLGFFLNIAFESPIINLENALFFRGDKSANFTSRQAQQAQMYEQTNKLSLLATEPFGLAAANGKGRRISDCAPNCTPDNRSKPKWVVGSDSQTSLSLAAAARDTHRNFKSASRLSVGLSGSEPSDDTEQSLASTPSSQCHIESSQSNADHPLYLTSSTFDSKRKPEPRTRHQAPSTRKAANKNHLDQTRPGPAVPADMRLMPSMDQPIFFGADNESNGALADNGEDRPQSSPETENDTNDLYSIAAEYRHYAPGIYQHWRGRSLGHELGRPLQYATLARTNQLYRDPSVLPLSRRPPWTELQQQHLQHYDDQTARQLRISSQRLESGTNFSMQTTTGLNGFMPRYNEAHLQQSGSELGIKHAPTVQPMRLAVPISNGPSASRRQTRYNTLTSGWRPSHEGRDRFTNQRLHAQWQQQQSELPLEQGWPNPSKAALLIPRVNSSTLRRKTQRNFALKNEPSERDSPPSPQSSQPQTNTSSSTLDQQHSQENKIVEEESLAAVEEETSAL